MQNIENKCIILIYFMLFLCIILCKNTVGVMHTVGVTASPGHFIFNSCLYIIIS